MYNKDVEQKVEIPKHPHDHHIAYTLLLLGLVCVIFAFILLSQFLTTVRQKPFPIQRSSNEVIIEDWMTISYLTKAYKIPEYVLFEKLDVTPQDFKKSIKTLAKMKKIPSEVFVEKIHQTIRQFQREKNQSKK